MSHFLEEIHAKNPWFDGLYQVRNNKKSRDWKALKEKDRFDQIINTPFAVKSNHSTLIQVADAICYVYRRYLELKTTQNSSEDLDYYTELFQILENSRVKLGQCPINNECLKFYRMIKHCEWSL